MYRNNGSFVFHMYIMMHYPKSLRKLNTWPLQMHTMGLILLNYSRINIIGAEQRTGKKYTGIADSIHHN